MDERPNNTTLATKDIRSPIIKSRGGFWTYVNKIGRTLWTLTNTHVLKEKYVFRLFLFGNLSFK